VVEHWSRANGSTLTKRDYEETPAVLEPLALRQFLADASFTGSGRIGDERRWAFRKRDAVLFELIALGFPLERVSDAVGLSLSRLSNLDVVKAARKAFKDSQRGMALYWDERGHSTKEIAGALGLPLRTIQRMVKEGSEPASDVPLAETSTMKLIGMALTHARVLAEMELWPERGAPQPPRAITLEEIREAEGIPIDYYERVPPGMPLQVESASYHSYVPGEQEQFGAPGDGDPTSRHDVLHPFLHTLLARTQPKRVHR
jgi:hypothetical protein